MSKKMMILLFAVIICLSLAGCSLQDKIGDYSREQCYLNKENVTQFSYKGNDYTILADTVSNSGLGEWIGYIQQLAAVDESGKILLQENLKTATFQTLADLADLVDKAPNDAYIIPFLNVYAAPNADDYLIVDINGGYHKAVIDENIKKWIRQTKEYAQKDYNNHTTLWSPQWTQDQGPDGNVFGFFYSTWGINFTLMGNALADSSKPAEKGNGIYGDYAVCEGPQAYYWGGTWMCAAQGTDNIPFIRDLMKRLTCDTKTMKQITLDTQDYTNNEKAMDEIAKSDYQSDFLGGQNHIALFAEAAKKIDMSNISDYDKDCNEQIQQCLHPYFEGKISLAQGMDDFYKKMEQLHPELSH